MGRARDSQLTEKLAIPVVILIASICSAGVVYVRLICNKKSFSLQLCNYLDSATPSLLLTHIVIAGARVGRTKNCEMRRLDILEVMTSELGRSID